MSESRQQQAEIAGLVGFALLAISLFLPWYAVDPPPSAFYSAEDLSAFRAFGWEDIVLVLLAGASLAALVRTRNVSKAAQLEGLWRLVAALGGVALCVCLYGLLVTPGSVGSAVEASRGIGAYVGVLGAAAILGAGISGTRSVSETAGRPSRS